VFASKLAASDAVIGDLQKRMDDAAALRQTLRAEAVQANEQMGQERTKQTQLKVCASV
tara:strand:- start:118 stop:291 length:174 start_codon:yes stop_codon:yes gene_type:complete